MGDELMTIKLAAAQVASVFLDRQATVEKACHLIREAGANGTMIAEAVTGGDQILYAEVDLNDVLIPKLFHDFSGHYNRFDIFSVSINRNAPPPLIEEPAPPPDEPLEQAGSVD